MARHKITMALSEDSIKNAIQELEEYRKDVIEKCKLLTKRLAECGEKVAVEKVSESPLGRTVKLRIDCEPEKMGCKAVLIATGKTIESEEREPFYTLLAIEFGAGIYYNRGNENPKANELGFGVGTYPGQIHAFEDGWYYLGNDDKWHYTHGVKATMPMYSASLEIIQKYREIAKEVFG
jgi:hypothetical protein